jgi:peptidoglycan/xylan/chitin deacetylase (PgdA/CDA1 family)
MTRLSFRPLSNVLAAALITLAASHAARAADCPGHPDALGTSRTLVVDPTEHPRVGTMQYPETLPLQDHEVVLTFDDGPLPKHTKPVLDILDSQCVKATFFIVGAMANAYPATVREIHDAGHTIGTHTQNHPLRMNKMTIDQNKAEIDGGIASTGAALGDPSQVAPFLRIPGLLRSTEVEDYLTSQGIMTWSADFPADDWHHISATKVAQLAISRLEAKGRGILLLHDIHQRTQSALPVILRELKARGYRVVHVVPASPTLPKTPTQPWQWHLHPSEPVIATDDGMRFVFAPEPIAAHNKQTALASVPVLMQKTANKGRMIPPVWSINNLSSRDDAISLLSPIPSAFHFREPAAPHTVFAKDGTMLPQE